MKNSIIEIDGQKAVISFSPDIQMFRGEFIGLSGGADFYADSVENLYKEGAISLKVYFEACAEEGIEPLKHFSGRLTVRLNEHTHKAAALAAKSEHKSLNQWVEDCILAAANDDYTPHKHFK